MATQVSALEWQRLRVVTGNLTCCGSRSYDSGEGIRIFQGLSPDVVLVQEFRYRSNSDEDFRDFTSEILGPQASYFRQNDKVMPNGVLSRYPIEESGTWTDPETETRDFAWARIDIPGPTDLWAVSVHLLTESTAKREAEAEELVARIQENVPDGDFLIIAGDFNTNSRVELCLDVLAQVGVTGEPFPADAEGNTDTNSSREKPFDWIVASANLQARIVPTEVGSNRFPAGLVLDTRIFHPIVDIHPAQADDSAADSMQHMAVVKDFSLPEVKSSSRLFFNELLANEPGSDVDQEFVEIANGSLATADLSDWTIHDSTGTVRHSFAEGTHLSPGTVLAVFAADASSGRLSLSNGGDTIVLRDSTGQEVDSVTYTASLAGEDGISLNRNPDMDGEAPLVPHTDLSSLPSSPGTRCDGID